MASYAGSVGSDTTAVEGSGSQMHPSGDPQNAAAQDFQRAAQQGPAGPQQTLQAPAAPVVASGSRSLFLKASHAARDALARAIPASNAANAEHGGILYSHRVAGVRVVSYTGPARSEGQSVQLDEPAFQPPAGSKLIGFYHTRCEYTEYHPFGTVNPETGSRHSLPFLSEEYNPETNSAHTQGVISDRFSQGELELHISLAVGDPGETREQREQTIRDTYGAPPVPSKDMRFYLASLDGETIREHRPGKQSSEATTAARNPITDQRIENGGTDRVLSRSRWIPFRT
jgi:hypothetical protein